MSTLMLDDLMIDEEHELLLRARIREKLHEKYGDGTFLDRVCAANIQREILKQEKAIFQKEVEKEADRKTVSTLFGVAVSSAPADWSAKWRGEYIDLGGGEAPPIMVSPALYKEMLKVSQRFRWYPNLSGNSKQRRTKRRALNRQEAKRV